MSDLRSELEAIRAKHGKLTPRVVLEEARDPGHVLHDRFEWDDAIAAEFHRLDQAYELIRAVRVSFEDSEGQPRNVRSYYAIRAADANEYTYDDLEEVMRDQFRRKVLFNEMQRRIDELVEQYGTLEEFWKKLRGLRRRKSG